eukprot:INCI17622.7.p2 GENE.INCI17622.7~~INCI17622.7.p2  ORF type:complete len:170 (-),score=43.13 INCI17622.7:1348-1857(-)
MQMPDTRRRETRQRTAATDSSETGNSQSLDDLRVRQKIALLKELHLKKGTAYKNPTATYEHTWMRVRTMSEKRLSTRVKVIERALGQHCIVKLRMFAEVLILSGMDSLAAEATAALERVLAAVQGSSSKSDKASLLREQAKNATMQNVAKVEGALDENKEGSMAVKREQ